MHPALVSSLERIERHFRRDDRCVAMFLTGSLGEGAADAYSDVDVAAAFRDDSYPEVATELRPVLERLCGPIVAWLPEGASESSCNYAFLFRAGDDLLLYDFLALKESAAASLAHGSVRVLFDRSAGRAAAEAPPRAAPFAAERVRWLVDNWWVYCYLNGKYLRRSDVFKLAYVQDALLQTHMQLLNASLSPATAWHWWPGDVKRLPADKRAQMRVYLGAPEPDDLRNALRTEMETFSRDARAACARWNVDYPAAIEAAVRQHLSGVGV